MRVLHQLSRLLAHAVVGRSPAGFFMGSSIKVVTKRADERYVHELRLAAADLEKRYLNREVRKQAALQLFFLSQHWH